MKTTGFFASLKIIHNGMLACQILFIAILFYLGYTKIRIPTLNRLDETLQVVAIALCAIAFFGGGIFLKKKLIAIKEDKKNSTKEKLHQYRVASIVQWAMFEITSLFCGLSYFFTGNFAFLALAVVLMFLFAMLGLLKLKLFFNWV